MMKKTICIALILPVALLMLASCTYESVILGESKTYEIAGEIHSLDIEINAADFTIEYGDKFSVESNLKQLSVSENNGVLVIIDEAKPVVSHADYVEAVLKLCVPRDTVFENVEITTGAGKLTAESLSANSLNLELGAGKVEFGSLNAYANADIEGGTGNITVNGGTLNNLTLELGVGKLDMAAALLGESDIAFGVGESNLTLLGSKDDYRVEIEKGIGSITFDGNAVSGSYSSGNGKNYVQINGGVGAVNIAFQE